MSKIMSPSELKTRLEDRAITRRDMNKVLASAGLASVILPVLPTSSWGQESEGQTYEADPDLTVFTWAGYDIAAFAGSYIARYGKLPSFSLWGEEEEGFQKMRAGFKPDIAWPCTYSLGRWRDAGLLSPLDTSKLVNWDDLFPYLRNLSMGVHEGNNYFVPVDWGNSSVLFRPDLAPEYAGEDNHSWKILFDEKYSGRLGIYDSVDGVFGVVGAVIGAKDPFNMTDEELVRATEMMRKQRDVLRFYWTDISAVEQGLASGELVASYAWNSSVLELKKQGIEIEYMNPKEGIYTWVCGLVRIATGGGPDEKAYEYINAVTSPESGVFEITEYGYGHSNMKAFEQVPQETLVDLGISDPTTFLADSRFFDEIKPEVREKYIELFEEVKAGL